MLLFVLLLCLCASIWAAPECENGVVRLDDMVFTCEAWAEMELELKADTTNTRYASAVDQKVYTKEAEEDEEEGIVIPPF